MSLNDSPQRSGAIATPHRVATDIGADVYAAGGNAVDAAIAASFALAVSYPHNTSIGGDLIALVKTPDNEIRCINASGTAAKGVDIAALRRNHGSKMPVHGVDTITVPGAVAGLEALHRMAGQAAWGSLLAPGIQLADEGSVVSASLGKAIASYLPQILLDEGMKSVFLQDGVPLREGDLLKQPALASTLRGIASGGAEAFYRGETGAALVEGLRRLGSPLSEEDFQSYKSADAPVLSCAYERMEIHTSGLNTQGFLLPQVMSAAALIPEHFRHAGIMANLWAQANRDRDRLLSDPEHSRASETEVLNEGYLQAMVQNALSHEAVPAFDSFPQPKGDTVAVVTADSDGYAACIIQSVFHPFGSLILEPATGVLLHNRGAFFSLDPSHANVIAAGKRPGHTLMPVMVSEQGALRWIMGTMGGKAQPQVHFQVLQRLLAGLSPAEAISHPRWIIGGLGADHPEDAVYCESDVPAADQVAITEAGFELTLVEPHSEMLGHANVVEISADGVFTAMSDPRSDGSGRTM